MHGRARSECPNLTVLAAGQDLPTALGVAYVLEGSTLGGRFVLAKLPPALAALRGRATAFLDGYGDQTGARWQAFGQLVEAHGAADPDACVAGARDCFAALVTWLATHESAIVDRVARRMPLRPIETR